MGAGAGAGRDRLAVWDWEDDGERVAAGDWLVSDAERAAAGRETITGRFLALLPENRERAARRHADGRLSDGEKAARVWCPRDVAALEARLADEDFTAWSEGDVLHVLWRGEADRAHLSGGIQVPLWPVDGAAGLWEASVRVRRLDEAVITLSVGVVPDGGTLFGRPAGEPFVFRGPGAPASARAEPLAGEVQEHVIDSAALGAARGVTVYLPPGAGDGGPLPGCVLADGQSVPGFAPVLEAAILAGTTPPVILVGVHNASVHDPQGRPTSDLRSLEYLTRFRSRRFGAHLSFVTGEVVPWAAGRFPLGRQPWAAAGFSSGAAWAIAAAQRRPDVFGGVAALSGAMVPRRITRDSRPVRHYLAAGTLEPGFRCGTGEWAARLGRAGMAYAHHEWVGGHDSWWWHQQLPVALGWLLSGERVSRAGALI
jgi:enterochelin esterase-like enzyme